MVKAWGRLVAVSGARDCPEKTKASVISRKGGKHNCSCEMAKDYNLIAECRLMLTKNENEEEAKSSRRCLTKERSCNENIKSRSRRRST